MTSELNKLVKSRSGYRLQVTNQVKKLDTVLNQTLDNATCNEIDILVTQIETLRAKMEALNSEILGLLSEEGSIDKFLSEDLQIEMNILDKTSRASHITKQFRSTNLTASAATENPPAASSSSSSFVTTKVPKLEIKPFSGDYMEWQTFWDRFKSAVHDRTDLKPIDKLIYLQSYITGDAEKTIKGYRTTAENYDVVVDTLKETYGNEQYAKFAHFQAFINLSSGSNCKLKEIYEDCERHIRSLVALGCNESDFSAVFTPLILSKLPRNVCVQLNRKNGSQPWTLDNLRKFMREELQALEMSDRFLPQKASTDSPPKGSKHQKDFQSYRPKSQIATQGALTNQTSSVTCAFCKEKHFSDVCSNFKTVESRMKALGFRNCFKCLGPNHMSSTCKRQKPCFHCKNLNHHSSLCRYHHPSQSTSKASSNDALISKPSYSKATTSSNKKESNMSSQQSSNTQVQMKMATVAFPNSNVTARLFLDSGCSRSYCLTKLQKDLHLPVLREELICYTRFRERGTNSEAYQVCQLELPTKSGTIDLELLVTDYICHPIHKFPLDAVQNPILQSIPLADSISKEAEEVQIDILIGEDYYNLIMDPEIVQLNNGMYLVGSKLGYIACGKMPLSASSSSTAFTNVALLSPLCVDQQLQQLWDLESIGVRDNAYDKDDQMALDQFNKTVRQTDEGRYEVTWPWKEKKPELPSNYGLAYGCLQGLLRRYAKEKLVFEEYDKIIQDQLQKGVIEEVSTKKSKNLVHYISHHPVIKQDHATTKIRVVYNASARPNKSTPSLNECLHRGPVLLHNLCGILFRFRLKKIGIACDVEKAFLQVGLQTPERDVTRFLWLRDIDKPLTKENLICFRFCRVPFGYSPSPFLLDATIKHHLIQQNSPVASDIVQNVYVDNVISGTDHFPSGKSYYEEAKALFSSISMNLREWFTNSSELQGFIKESNPSDEGKGKPKVLGLHWNLEPDALTCSSFVDCASSTTTKRSVLKSVSTVFDPAGFFCPITIRGRILIQKIWKENLPWDQPLPGQLSTDYQRLQPDLAAISSISVPRFLDHYLNHQDVDHQLHCFCDASKSAYATAIYLRTTAKDQPVSTNLIFAKSRVCPVKEITLPRLELLAVLLGTYAVKYVSEELKLNISSIYVWTDAKVVLSWISSQKVQTVFVQNRIREIKKHDYQYRYVPTTQNPADIPTRGCSTEELESSNLWWHGPSFLNMSSEGWPMNDINSSVTDTETDKSATEPAALVSSPKSAILHGIHLLIQISDFSNLIKPMRITAFILRFINNCRSKTKNHSPLSSSEIAAATKLWILNIQASQFNFNDSLSNLSNRYKSLNLFRDSSGVLRCRGRLEHSSLPQSAREPILLPENHHFTSLIILHCHVLSLHSGAKQTLSELRNHYWVIRGRSQVSKVINQCRLCRKAHGGPFKTPPQPPLPEFRVSSSIPFSATGIDYIGPLFIKSDSSEASSVKVWLCLFTCAVTRAVHLEVVLDNTCDEFLLALQRFSSIYGSPKLLISDNAKTFVSADKVLKSIVLSGVVQDYSATKGISWKFIPAFAPWMGGMYERMIGTVKRCLRKLLGPKHLSLVQLQTLVLEVASIVNSRPLVHSSTDVGDLALTPSHFLLKRGQQSFVGSIDETKIDPDFLKQSRGNLVEAWKKGQNLLDQFWHSWHKEYLAVLREQKVKDLSSHGSSSKKVNVGDVVLIKEPVPRVFWKLGKIVDVHRSSDGCIRSASVQLSNRKKLHRPVKLLCPLEQSNEPIIDSNANHSNSPSVSISDRPKRKSAVDCRQKIKTIFREESASESE